MFHGLIALLIIKLRVAAINNCARLRRVLVRLQGASAGARICAGECNAVGGPKDKQYVQLCLPRP